MSIKHLFCACLVLAGIQCTLISADEPTAAEKLATESEAYCTSTIKDKPTAPDVIVNKVKEACTVLEKEGPAAFPKFQGKNSTFITEGTYVWVHTLGESEMLMHPIKVKMVGTKIVGLKDAKGKRFFVAMNNLVKEKGEGWVEYYWVKPGSDEPVRKISFVKKCTMSNGVEVVVGMGIYNISDADRAKLEVR